MSIINISQQLREETRNGNKNVSEAAGGDPSALFLHDFHPASPDPDALKLICGDSDAEGSKVNVKVGFSDRKSGFCGFAEQRDLQLHPDHRDHLLILRLLLGLTRLKQMSAQSLTRTPGIHHFKMQNLLL